VSSQVSSHALRNFLDTCKSSDTRYVYRQSLHLFMNHLKIGHNDYDKLLDKDPKIIQEDIIRFIIDYTKKIAPATLSLYVGAIRKFYTMNDITNLNWKKIRSFEPERQRVAEDRPYIHSEIKSLIDRASLRNKCIILLMSSSGMRVGAIPPLRVKDLERIESDGIYKINVYAKTRQNYYTFCSPECAASIDQYIEWRKRSGERITEESILFRSDFNAHNIAFSKPKPISIKAIMKAITKLWIDVGMKKQKLETEVYKRNEIMRCHGLRKFFETNAFKAGMDHIYIRRLLGQKSGLEDSYLKLSEEELLEGDSKHVGYVGIVDQLTINEENRLKREVQILKIRSDRLETIMKRVDTVEKILEDKLRSNS
jgi:integrase